MNSRTMETLYFHSFCMKKKEKGDKYGTNHRGVEEHEKNENVDNVDNLVDRIKMRS